MEQATKKRLEALGVKYDAKTVCWDETRVMREMSVTTASEAVWPILGYHLSESTHVVTPLAVHEPFKESVLYAEGQEEEAGRKYAESGATSGLTAWFQLNRVGFYFTAKTDTFQQDVEARQYTYAEIANHYVYHNYKKLFTRRKKKV